MLQKTDSPVPSLLFFGGPYGNLQSLTALRSIAEGMRLPPSSIICTGDTVAYCAQPSETVEAIRSWGIQVVAGNVELQLANDAGERAFQGIPLSFSPVLFPKHRSANACFEGGKVH